MSYIWNVMYMCEDSYNFSVKLNKIPCYVLTIEHLIGNMYIAIIVFIIVGVLMVEVGVAWGWCGSGDNGVYYFNSDLTTEFAFKFLRSV